MKVSWTIFVMIVLPIVLAETNPFKNIMNRVREKRSPGGHFKKWAYPQQKKYYKQDIYDRADKRNSYDPERQALLSENFYLQKKVAEMQAENDKLQRIMLERQEMEFGGPFQGAYDRDYGAYDRDYDEDFYDSEEVDLDIRGSGAGRDLQEKWDNYEDLDTFDDDEDLVDDRAYGRENLRGAYKTGFNDWKKK